MPILKFKTKDVLKLVNELELASSFSPTIEDLFNAALYPDGIVRDEQGRTESEAENAGDFFWPSASKIDPEKVQPSLSLVGDHGVYLMTNAKLEGTPSSRGTVVYAEGCNPDLDEDFYENKELLFGGDDGSVPLPVSWAKWAISANKLKCKVKLGSNSIELIKK